MLIASRFRKDRLNVLLAKSRGGGSNNGGQAGGSWELGFDFSYGGKDGPKLDGYVKGEAHDDRGNYVEGRVDHNFNDNEGTVGVHGGNREEENK